MPKKKEIRIERVSSQPQKPAYVKPDKVDEVNGVRSYTFGGTDTTFENGGVTEYETVRDYYIGNMSVPVGTQLSVVRGVIYANGGMLEPTYQRILGSLIKSEEDGGFHYLRRLPMKYNRL